MGINYFTTTSYVASALKSECDKYHKLLSENYDNTKDLDIIKQIKPLVKESKDIRDESYSMLKQTYRHDDFLALSRNEQLDTLNKLIVVFDNSERTDKLYLKAFWLAKESSSCNKDIKKNSTFDYNSIDSCDTIRILRRNVFIILFSLFTSLFMIFGIRFGVWESKLIPFTVTIGVVGLVTLITFLVFHTKKLDTKFSEEYAHFIIAGSIILVLTIVVSFLSSGWTLLYYLVLAGFFWLSRFLIGKIGEKYHGMLYASASKKYTKIISKYDSYYESNFNEINKSADEINGYVKSLKSISEGMSGFYITKSEFLCGDNHKNNLIKFIEEMEKKGISYNTYLDNKHKEQHAIWAQEEEEKRQKEYEEYKKTDQYRKDMEELNKDIMKKAHELELDKIFVNSRTYGKDGY